MTRFGRSKAENLLLNVLFLLLASYKIAINYATCLLYIWVAMVDKIELPRATPIVGTLWDVSPHASQQLLRDKKPRAAVQAVLSYVARNYFVICVCTAASQPNCLNTILRDTPQLL